MTGIVAIVSAVVFFFFLLLVWNLALKPIEQAAIRDPFDKKRTKAPPPAAATRRSRPPPTRPVLDTLPQREREAAADRIRKMLAPLSPRHRPRPRREVTSGA